MLQSLLCHPKISSIHAFTRRDLASTSPKLHAIKPLPDTEAARSWPTQFPTSPTPQVLFSGLATTRANAGGLQAQHAIDHDLNLSLAQAARAAGATTYVLISTAGANARSWFFYPRMKGELEEAVQRLGFDHVVLVRPGFIGGHRAEARPAETVLKKLVGGVAWMPGGKGVAEGLMQPADWIARAAVRAGVECVEGTRDKGVWILDTKEIVRLGREEIGKREGEAQPEGEQGGVKG